MPPTPPSTPEPGEARIRDRGDACPGALRLHPADDGRLARLRLPGGLLTARQAELLATAAESLGDGRISITSRGNAELRGLADDCGARLAALLDDAGLLPSPGHERVRNIVASPAADLTGLGHATAQLWARDLDSLLCAEPWTTALSGRFLFVLDAGRGDVAGLGGDVTLIAVGAEALPGGDAAGPATGAAGGAAGGEGAAGGDASDADAAARGALGSAGAHAPAGGSPAAAGGGAGPGAGRVPAPQAQGCPVSYADGAAGPHTGRGHEPAPEALLYVGGQFFRVAGEDAARAALAGAEAFLAAAREAGNGAWRVRELPPGTVLDVAGALARAAIAAEPVPDARLPHRDPPEPGVLGATGLYVLAPLGRLTAAQLRALADGAEELRFTPWRGVVVVGAAHRPADAGGGSGMPGTAPYGNTNQPVGAGDMPHHRYDPSARLRALDALGLVTSARAPLAGVSACTGRPGCGKALADVRADAEEAPAGGLPVHYSGCERRCGHPHGAWVDVLAVADGGYLVDGAPTPRTSLTEAVATSRTTR
ncbi:cobalamin biosynthesis protein CobG [Streptomyces sp. NPDC012769]|uniref:cobalamin biosynthesis protein CobG n=1 Tax=Streptomyces sp. NPDC012769 TaxID=3364848 RepID=UPI00367B8C67